MSYPREALPGAWRPLLAGSLICPLSPTGLSSVRTSSPHLAPAAPPAPHPGPVCSLHPPQDKAEAPAARPRSSYARKALSQPQGGFPPAWPSAPRSPCLKFRRSAPCSGLSRTLTERLSVWAPGWAWGAQAPPGLENSQCGSRGWRGRGLAQLLLRFAVTGQKQGLEEAVRWCPVTWRGG